MRLKNIIIIIIIIKLSTIKHPNTLMEMVGIETGRNERVVFSVHRWIRGFWKRWRQKRRQCNVASISVFRRFIVWTNSENTTNEYAFRFQWKRINECKTLYKRETSQWAQGYLLLTFSSNGGYFSRGKGEWLVSWGRRINGACMRALVILSN